MNFQQSRVTPISCPFVSCTNTRDNIAKIACIPKYIYCHSRCNTLNDCKSVQVNEKVENILYILEEHVLSVLTEWLV